MNGITIYQMEVRQLESTLLMEKPITSQDVE